MKNIVSVILAVAALLGGLTIAIITDNHNLKGYDWAVPYLLALIVLLVVLATRIVIINAKQEREKKTDSSSSSPIHPENKQTIIQQANPQQTVNVYHDSRTSAAEEEKRRLEETAISFIKQITPKSPCDIKQMTVDPQFANVTEVWRALERLEKQGRLKRIQIEEATGGFLWELTDLERLKK